MKIEGRCVFLVPLVVDLQIEKAGVVGYDGVATWHRGDNGGYGCLLAVMRGSTDMQFPVESES